MILSEENILRELAFNADNSSDITSFLESGDDMLYNYLLEETEADQYNKITRRLKLDVLDVEQFVKVNDCPCVTDPRAFVSNNIPSPEGLLSNKLFGTAQRERAGTFGYIDLHGWFMDPSCYKTWIRLDSRVKNIVFGTRYYTIDSHGDFVEDENGNTGLDWLRKNIKKIKFKDTGSKSKQLSIKYLETNRDKMWINKYIVIPPYYRDKNTSSNSRVTVGLGGVNKLYTNLIVASNALLTPQEYGFDAEDADKGRIQNIILQIYDFFCGNSNKELPADAGRGMSGKLGILRMTNMSKTADFSSRLVISPVDLKVNKPEDRMVTYEKSAVPLYSAITQFRDFVMFNVREFFENEFTGSSVYPVVDAKGNTKYIYPEDPDIVFSDERIAKEMDRFLEGYNNRFVPIQVPVEDSNEVYYMKYKGMYRDPSNPDSESKLIERRLTWCDIFFIATVEAVKDKHVIITRFPIDSFSNQFTTKVEVASTVETEEIEYNGQIYKYYPKIREEDIGKNTSNIFSDTLKFSNTYLASIGGDFDGDQCTCKGVYTREANDELENFMHSKQNFVTFGCKPLKEPGADSIQAMYVLTKVLSDSKITNSNNIQYK